MKHLCECGCGKEVTIYRGKSRRFIQGHHMKVDYIRKMHSKRMMGNKLFQGGKMPQSAKDKIAKSQTGVNNSVWNGGRTISGDGYITILQPEHPFADVNGRIKEERLVMEKHLGRYLLKTEIIHHINRNKQDNRIENLQIVTSLEHGRIHHKGNAYALGYKFTEEQRRNSSKSKLGRIVSEKTKHKLSISHMGKTHTKEACKKISIARQGSKDSIQTRINKSISAKIAWSKRKKSC